MIAHGYSDLVTPYASNKYVVDHLPDSLAGRVTFKVYRGGHMLYTRAASRAAFTADAKAFYAGQAKD
jgi:carboxypeptidase C (cathepsin A)